LILGTAASAAAGIPSDGHAAGRIGLSLGTLALTQNKAIERFIAPAQALIQDGSALGSRGGAALSSGARCTGYLLVTRPT
jgi:hypothetical protein